MAEKFGGKFSPGDPDPGKTKTGSAPAKNSYKGKRRGHARGRVNMLFLAAFPFLITAFWQEPVGLLRDLTAFGALVLAAWLTREGILAHEAYDARGVAKRPAIPRKLFASALTGLGLFIGGYGGEMINALIFGCLGFTLHFLAFGPDPLRDKGMAGVDSYQSNRVARAVEEAERHLAAMRDAIRRAGDRSLEARVEKFQGTARDMFRTIENDPRDLVAARRYLGVYLLGAKDATVKFADLWSRTSDIQARADYEALLSDLESNFSARTRTLLADDRSALDIEIGVLRERLEREGIRTED